MMRFIKSRRAQKFGRAVLSALILLAACACAAAQTTAPEKSVQAALREIYTGEDGDFRYFIKWFDLDGDGVPEAVVYVVGPSVCGTGGCDTHVLARRGDAYKLVSTISLTHPLIIASPRRSHGWRDLLVFVAGGGILPGYYVELKFDGKTYPENPTVPPARRVRAKPGGVVLIKDFKFYTEGRRLPPAPGKSD